MGVKRGNLRCQWNSCCDSVTGQYLGGCCEQRPLAGGGEGGHHDAGGHRAEAGQGLGKGARSTLGKGALTVISELMMMTRLRH